MVLSSKRPEIVPGRARHHAAPRFQDGHDERAREHERRIDVGVLRHQESEGASENVRYPGESAGQLHAPELLERQHEHNEARQAGFQ
jgi:hypothetical protein